MEPYMEPIHAGKTLEEIFSLQETCKSFLARRHNMHFSELLQAALSVGFEEERITGSHHILKHPVYSLQDFPHKSLNLQPVKGKAKPKQIKDFVDFVQLAMPIGDTNE